MTAMVIPIDSNGPQAERPNGPDRLHVTVHIQADVLEPETARRQANRWLLQHVGNLLRAEPPELLLGERLLWRFPLRLTQPDLETPGRGRSDVVGVLHLDAVRGEVVVSETFVQELQACADAIAVH